MEQNEPNGANIEAGQPQESQPAAADEASVKPAESSEIKQETPKLNLPKISLPKFKLPEGGIAQLIKSKLSDYVRVLKITKKPDSAEFKAIVKASGLGILIIGFVGFIIAMIAQAIKLLG